MVRLFQWRAKIFPTENGFHQNVFLCLVATIKKMMSVTMVVMVVLYLTASHLIVICTAGVPQNFLWLTFGFHGTQTP